MEGALEGRKGGGGGRRERREGMKGRRRELREELRNDTGLNMRLGNPRVLST